MRAVFMTGIVLSAMFCPGARADDLRIDPYPFLPVLESRLESENASPPSPPAQENQGAPQPSANVSVKRNFQAPPAAVPVRAVNGKPDGVSGGSAALKSRRLLEVFAPPGPPPARVSPQKDWRVKQGGFIRDTLESWSREDGTAFIWEGADDLEVRESLNMYGGYEMAVQALLSQYNYNDVRPVGHLYIDEENGERTLVVSVLGGP